MERLILPISRHDTALLVIDMQNDFLHPCGAYARGGSVSPTMAALPDQIAPLVEAARAAGIYTLATQFTLVPDRSGQPMISAHMRQLRPFLTRGDFLSGTFGHATLGQLGAFDTLVEKVAFSAFYQSRLEFVLNRAGIRDVMLCGIVTNGGVASTAREAQVRDFSVTVIGDACAAASTGVHDAALADLANVVAVRSRKDVLEAIEGDKLKPTGVKQ